ncbi:hypothetical protein H0W91_03870 [Patescibacteria group bacterium]|nr:hypothetical protein [Patescibacteria group bacterium]
MNTLIANGILGNPWLILIAALWILPWKGVALWKAAQLSHKGWFIALLVVNTLGVLDIIYIFFIAKKYTVEIESR